jgi:hypothetical protein
MKPVDLRALPRAVVGGTIGSSRRSDGEQHASEHHDESESAHERLLDDDTDDDRRDAEQCEQGSHHDDGVVRLAAALSHCGYEVGVVLIETPLHLFQEALLLLGKCHVNPSGSDYLRDWFPIIRPARLGRL